MTFSLYSGSWWQSPHFTNAKNVLTLVTKAYKFFTKLCNKIVAFLNSILCQASKIINQNELDFFTVSMIWQSHHYFLWPIVLSGIAVGVHFFSDPTFLSCFYVKVAKVQSVFLILSFSKNGMQIVHGAALRVI